MVDYEITTIAAAIDEAIKELLAAREAKSAVLIKKVEETICIETRSLFSRYVDVVLWSSEFDKAMHLTARNALEKGRDAVSWRATDSAASVERRLEEFDKFSKKHWPNRKFAPVSRGR